MPEAIRRTGTARTGEAEPGTHLPATAYQRTSGSAPADEGSRTDHPDLHTTNRRSQAPRCRPDRRVGARLFGLWRGLSRPGMTYWMIACSVYSYIATFGVTIRICRRQGHPGLPGVGTFVRSCMPHAVRHPDGETDRQSRRRGRAAGTAARTIRMPPMSSIWIPGRRWHQPWVIRRSGIRRATIPGNATAEPTATAQTARAQEDTAARSVHPLSRHSR